MWPPHLLFPSSWGYNINYKVKTLNDVLRTTTKAALSVFLYYLRVWQEFYLFLKCLNQVFMSGKGKKRNIKLDSKGEQLEKIILTDFLYCTKVLWKCDWMWSRKGVNYLHKLIKVLIWKYKNQGNALFYVTYLIQLKYFSGFWIHAHVIRLSSVERKQE